MISFLVLVTGVAIYVHWSSGFVSDPWLRRNTPYEFFPVFWYGSLAGIIGFYRDKYGLKFELNTKKKKITAEVVVYLIFLRIYLGNTFITENLFGWDTQNMWGSQWSNAPFYALLLLVLDSLNDDCSFGRFFSSHFWFKLGEVSYSTYLFQAYTLGIIFEISHNPIKLDWVFLSPVLAFAFGYVCYYLIEKNGVKLGDKILKKIRQRIKPESSLPLKVKPQDEVKKHIPDEVKDHIPDNLQFALLIMNKQDIDENSPTITSSSKEETNKEQSATAIVVK